MHPASPRQTKLVIAIPTDNKNGNKTMPISNADSLGKISPDLRTIPRNPEVPSFFRSTSTCLTDCRRNRSGQPIVRHHVWFTAAIQDHSLPCPDIRDQSYPPDALFGMESGHLSANRPASVAATHRLPAGRLSSPQASNCRALAKCLCTRCLCTDE